MKRLLCLLAALLLLTGCTAPGLRSGYYLVPLEESEAVPVYLCLESGGTGYLHAMGQDVPVDWTREGLGGDLADGVPTPEGLSFPVGDGSLVLTWSKTLPEGYADVYLRPGYYVPREETLDSLLTYAHLRPDGTGTFSIMGMEKEVTWTPEVLFFGDMTIYATAEGFLARDSVSVPYRYTGDALPEGYLTRYEE